MANKVKLKEELVKEKTITVEKLNAKHTKSTKPAILTKKEKKALGIGKDQGKAELRYVRLSARKVKIVLDLFKHKDLDEAYGIINFTPKAASEVLIKLLKSAEANAVNNNGLNRDELFVADAYANQGPTMKRLMPRAQGRANRIRKRTSHITLIVKERK